MSAIIASQGLRGGNVIRNERAKPSFKGEVVVESQTSPQALLPSDSSGVGIPKNVREKYRERRRKHVDSRELRMNL